MTKVSVLASAVIATTAIVLSCRDRNSMQPSNSASVNRPTVAATAKQYHADWEAFFKALEERTKEVDLESLRHAKPHEKDLEMRFWYDGRPRVINGFVIRRLGDQWAGIGIRQIESRWPSHVTKLDLGEPKSGWDALWKKLVDSGLLSLPDSDQTKCRTEVLDGVAFVIETNVSGTYRMFRYSNPQLAACDEAKRVMSLESIIADEFGLDLSGNR